MRERCDVRRNAEFDGRRIERKQRLRQLLQQSLLCRELVGVGVEAAQFHVEDLARQTKRVASGDQRLECI